MIDGFALLCDDEWIEIIENIPKPTTPTKSDKWHSELKETLHTITITLKQMLSVAAL